MATSAERMRALRERERRGIRRLAVDVSEDDLRENIDSFIHHIRRLKPPTSKGHFLKKVCIHGTMSPAVELEVAQ